MGEVELYLAMLVRLIGSVMPEVQAEEIAQAKHLTPTNPSWQDEKRLTSLEKKELQEYLKSLKHKSSEGQGSR